MKPLISVIVPIYKVELYVKRCIDSIINQTYNNLEIILVDDGSPDNSGKICDEYAEKDSRIAVIHKTNGGLGFARNSGIEIFSGKYVMFVDADDYLRLDCVDELYNRLTADQSDIAVGNYIKVFEDGRTKAGFTKCPKDCVLSRSCVLASYSPHLIYVTAWGKLFKRDIIKKISYPALTCGEDTWVFSSIIQQCNSISFVNKELYHYYQRSDSIVHSRSERKTYDSIYADLRLIGYLVKEGYAQNASAMFTSCVDRAILLSRRDQRIGLFCHYFNRKTRYLLLKETDYKTKIKWIGLFIPYFSHLWDIYAKIKTSLF